MFYLTTHSTHFIYGYMKEIFYLTTHSTHFIYGYIKEGRKEGNVLFNDALKTFYLRLYGVGHMVNTTQIVRGNPLPPHGLLFPINSKGSFTDRIAYATAFVTPVVELWLEREIAQWAHPMKD